MKATERTHFSPHLFARKIFILCIGLSLLLLATAKGQDLTARVKSLDQEIAKTPKDAALLAQRGNLLRMRKDFTNALRDLDQSLEFGGPTNQLHYLRALTLFEWKKPQEARAVLIDSLKLPEPTTNAATRITARLHLRADHYKPAHLGEVTLLAANVFTELSNYVAAAVYFNEATALFPKLPPDTYLDHAKVLALANSNNISAAVSVLERGQREHPNVLALKKEAVELEVQAGNYKEALKRLDQMISSAPRPEAWRLRKAEVHLLNKQPDPAKRELTECLKLVEALPPARRSLKANKDLEKKARELLAEVQQAK
jgi:tetratricopeptide (TPR) repeat protein